MKKYLIGVLATIGGLSVLGFLGFVFLMMTAASSKPRVPDGAVLEISVSGEYVESKPPDLLAQIMLEEVNDYSEALNAITRARDDERVVGMVARIDQSNLGFAKTQELRDAIRKFRDKGKFAYAFSETFGEWGGGNLPYYLATGFDSVYLAPSGDVNVLGIALTAQFLRGTFDKLGIYPDMDHIGDYKTAMNTLTEKALTPAHREMFQWLADDLYAQLVRGIAAGRGLEEAQVDELMRRGPYLGKEALDAKLVDELLYADQVRDKVEARAGKRKRIAAGKYLKAAGGPYDAGKDRLALIYGAGAVRRGDSGYDGFMGELAMGSTTVSKAVRDAADNEKIRGILLRVDSPGGSYVASDLIWRELVRAKEKKPIVVSMSDVAGSGGYFVALPGNKIFAQPGSITTSIGVFGGKLNVKGLYDKLGISFGRVEKGDNASMFWPYQNYEPAERERFRAALDRIYMDFSTKVAEARGMEWAAVDAVGRGRVFTGAQAKERGLIDELGGLEEAVAALKELAKIPAEDKVRLEVFPKPSSTIELLLERGNVDGGSLALLREHLRAAQAHARLAARANQAAGALRMPAVEVLE